MELHPIVPTLLLIPVIVGMVVLTLWTTGRFNTEASRQAARDTATEQVKQGFVSNFCPVANIYEALKPSDPTNKVSVKNTENIVKVWTDLAHFIGCPDVVKK